MSLFDRCLYVCVKGGKHGQGAWAEACHRLRVETRRHGVTHISSLAEAVCASLKTRAYDATCANIPGLRFNQSSKAQSSSCNLQSRGGFAGNFLSVGGGRTTCNGGFHARKDHLWLKLELPWQQPKSILRFPRPRSQRTAPPQHTWPECTAAARAIPGVAQNTHLPRSARTCDGCVCRLVLAGR